MPREFENPFTPTFGEIPAHLAGRQQILSGIDRALVEGKRRPELTTIFSGARGTGKTTLLSIISNRAEERGWIVANTTCGPGMLEDVEAQAHRHAEHLVENGRRTRIGKVGVPQVLEISFEKDTAQQGNWRARMEDLVEQLESAGAGLLVTVDEVDAKFDELASLVTVYQHFVREGRRAALVMAGLPSKVSILLNDDALSFTRRSEIVKLGRIADHDIAVAFRSTVQDNGRTLGECGLREAVDAIGGFPFLMQLVGFRSWDMHPAERELSDSDIRAGIEAARADLRVRIFDATYRELSQGDIDFLAAMLLDDGDSAISDIGKRLGKSSSLVSQYRRRLIEAGVIGERRRGVIGFELPYFRDYLADELAGA